MNPKNLSNGIEAMRALRDLPAIENNLQTGALNLSTLARAQSVMREVDDEKKLQVLSQIENKSQKETEAILISHFGAEQVKSVEKVRQISVEQSEIKTLVSSEFLEKLEKVRNLFSHKNPHASVAEVIEMAFDFVISKKDLSKNNAPPPPQRRSLST